MRREIHEEKEVVKKEKVVVSKSATCNRCGKTDTIENLTWKQENYFFAGDIHSIRLGFGYGSKFDMESWNFDLCDDCLEDVVKTFKYPPDGFMEDGYNLIQNEKERQSVFEDYKKTGEWNELKFKSYDELKSLAGLLNIEYINETVKENYPDKPLIEEE